LARSFAVKKRNTCVPSRKLKNAKESRLRKQKLAAFVKPKKLRGSKRSGNKSVTFLTRDLNRSVNT